MHRAPEPPSTFAHVSPTETAFLCPCDFGRHWLSCHTASALLTQMIPDCLVIGFNYCFNRFKPTCKMSMKSPPCLRQDLAWILLLPFQCPWSWKIVRAELNSRWSRQWHRNGNWLILGSNLLYTQTRYSQSMQKGRRWKWGASAS